MKKTGIMGGSFNPIHVGHLEIAECAWKEYGLDEILFIPNYCPPHKDSSEMLDAKSRLDMVKLAIQGHPNYTVTDREIQKGGLSYTYLTINELKAEEPDTEFYFLMGADSLADFRKWSHAEVIASKCHILAAMRDELGDEDVKQIADELSLEYHGRFFSFKNSSNRHFLHADPKRYPNGEQYFRKGSKSRRRLYLNTPFILPKTNTEG